MMRTSHSRLKVSRRLRVGALGLLLAGVIVPVLAREVPLMERVKWAPAPKTVVAEGETFPFPKRLRLTGIELSNPQFETTHETLRSLVGLLPGVAWGEASDVSSYLLKFERDETLAHAEGYTLRLAHDGATVTWKTPAGAFYGAQTLYQIFAYAGYSHRFLLFGDIPLEKERRLPVVTVRDEPGYRQRSFLVDLGRAPFSLPLLKRLVRISAHLKINLLHVRLYDDELGGFRFKKLPMGQENPFALTREDLRELVVYARRYHVAVMPELESWAHVESITRYFPELRGGEGMYGGASFAIGEQTYALLEKIYDEVVPCLEDETAVHVGLDEAVWSVMPGEENRGHTPTSMVARIHEILMRVGKRHGKKITMHLWADHGGRPLPEELKQKVVVGPWGYHESMRLEIVKKLAEYGGPGKTPVMMGAGVSWIRSQGDYEATRIWCQEGAAFPNVLGVTLCLWGSNDLGGRLLTLYGGASLAWSPFSFVRTEKDPLGEHLRNAKSLEMRRWQALFPDADTQAIALDRGPEVEIGRYVNAPAAGAWVVPLPASGPTKK